MSIRPIFSRKLQFILLIFLSITGCKISNFQPKEITGNRIPVDAEIAGDPEIEAFIEPYARHLNKTLDSVVAYNPRDLNKIDGELNTAIGNLMADIIMEQANPVFHSRSGNYIEVVLLNHGGIRSSIPQGAITARTAYSIMPFENEIVVAELTGSKMKELLSYLESNRTAHPISGMQIIVDDHYNIVKATVNGKQIENDETYFVATSDYLQQGGDNMVFFKDPVNLYRVDYKMRNAFIDYFNKTDTLRTSRDNRYIKK